MKIENNKIANIERFLYSEEDESSKQYFDNFGFLCGKYAYKNPDELFSTDCYYTFDKIRDNDYNFIIGNGGLGKTTFLYQIQQKLNSDDIPSLKIDLKDLTNEAYLSRKFLPFCKKHKIEEVFIIFDALDEAIDIGVQNPAIIVKNTIELCLKINKKIKTIITCRDNRFPDNIVTSFQKLYHCEKKNIYSLCSLTEDNVKCLAKHYECKNIEIFVKKIKEYNLVHFAVIPITLKALITMFNNDKLNSDINHYDLYDNLMWHLCDESEYRKEKANNKEGKFENFAIKYKLATASKIAIELKFNNKNYATNNSNDDNGYFIEQIYDFKIKDLVLTKDLVDETLRTKIFYRNGNSYYISQKTFQDFLAAKYLYEMKIPNKKFNKILEKDFLYHPNLIESIAYLSTKNEYVFDKILKKMPEKILFSSVFFQDKKQRGKLFKAYLNCVKDYKISIWNYQFGRTYFHKRLCYAGIENKLKRHLLIKNSTIKEAILDFIQDNKLKGFNKNCEKLIFKNKNINLIIAAIDVSAACDYYDVLEKLAKNISDFDELIEKDNSDQLRGCILQALYPKYIDLKTTFKYLKERSDKHFYGKYGFFLNYVLPESINKNNSKIILNWMKENKIKNVVKSEYGDGYSECANKIFAKISNFINKELIEEIVDFQISSKRFYQFFSSNILEKILSNNSFRIYFIEQMINKSALVSNNFELFIRYMGENLFNTFDIPYFFKLFLEEKQEDKKENIKIFINNQTCNFFNNNLIEDIEPICNAINNNKELKNNFGDFINPVLLSPKTLEPVEKRDIISKKWYYEDLKNRKETAKNLAKVKRLNNIQRQVDDILNKKNKNNDLQKLCMLFQIINLEKDTENYQYKISLDIATYERWSEISAKTQQEIVELVKKFLLKKPVSEENKIDKLSNSYKTFWWCFSLLPEIKKNDHETYTKILQNWFEIILYMDACYINEVKMKQAIVKDISNILSNKIIDTICKIILKKHKEFLNHGFFEVYKYIWTKELNKKLFDFLNVNEEKLNFDIQLEILKFIVQSKENCIKEYLFKKIKNSKKETEKLGNFLNILLYNYPDNWNYVKNIINKNKNAKQLLYYIIKNKTNDFSNTKTSLFAVLNSKQLCELYNLIIKKFPDINNMGYDKIDNLKDFTDKIIQFFIENGDIKSYKKIKKAYLTNRKCTKTYKIYYKKGLQALKFNKAQKSKININKLKKLEGQYYMDKKNLNVVQIGKNNFQGNNYTVNFNEGKKQTGNIFSALVAFF